MNSSQRTAKDITDSVANLCSEPRIISDKEKDIARYVLEKTLRLSSATLLVTSLLDTQGHIRGSLERTSIRLVEDASRAPAESSARSELVSGLRTLGALFETLNLAGLVARSNTEIISEEVVALIEFLCESSWVEGYRSFASDLFAVSPGPNLYRTDVYQRQSTTHQGQGTVESMRHEGSTASGDTKDTRVQQKDNVTNVQNQHKERTQEVQKDRRATILGIIQRKDRITVRDVTSVIKDCSEKTIQRELLALVGQGVLVKEGERRWSTYRLA